MQAVTVASHAPEPNGEPAHQDVIGPALKLARYVLNLTQQQAGETIGLGPDAAKNVFALYERGARIPSSRRLPAIMQLVRRATFIVEQKRKPAPSGGIARSAPAILDDVELAALHDLAEFDRL